MKALTTRQQEVFDLIRDHTIFDRKKQVVSDSYIFKGVMQGAAEGMEDYQKIYPKP